MPYIHSAEYLQPSVLAPAEESCSSGEPGNSGNPHSDLDSRVWRSTRNRGVTLVTQATPKNPSEFLWGFWSSAAREHWTTQAKLRRNLGKRCRPVPPRLGLRMGLLQLPRGAGHCSPFSELNLVVSLLRIKLGRLPSRN